MKIVATLFFVTSIVGMASGQSGRYQSEPTDVHLLDVLQYTCINILPQMGNLNYISAYFGQFKEELQPVCDFILEEAGAPDGFDATEFCNFLVDFFELRELMQPTVDDFIPDNSLERSLWMTQILDNITKILYGIDTNDPSAICPNAHRFFRPSLWDLYEEFAIEYNTELYNVIMPEMESICQDMEGYFVRLGVQDDSPYLRLVTSLLEIGADITGFQSFENLCQKARLAKLFDGDGSTRRMLLKDIFMSAFEREDITHVIEALLENIKQQ